MNRSGNPPPTGPPPPGLGRPPWWFYAAIGAAVAVAAGLFIVRSGDDGGSAGSPSSVATTQPATREPPPSPTAEPSEASPSPNPSPSPMVPEGVALGASCSYDREGYGIDYPAGWFTPSDPDRVCQLFDPQPIAVERDTELPIVAVTVYVDQHRMGRVRAALTDPMFFVVISEGPGTFSDAARPGMMIETEQTDDLLWPAGTHTFSVLVNRVDTTLVVTTNDLAAGDYEANRDIAVAMAESLRIGG